MVRSQHLYSYRVSRLQCRLHVDDPPLNKGGGEKNENKNEGEQSEDLTGLPKGLSLGVLEGQDRERNYIDIWWTQKYGFFFCKTVIF